MHRPITNDKLLLEAVEHRYCTISESADIAHARELRKERRLTSCEQLAHKPSQHRKRVRRHVQMIAIDVPHADELRSDNPEHLLARGFATKTASVNRAEAFRPIQKKRDRFERNAIRALKQKAEISWD